MSILKDWKSNFNKEILGGITIFLSTMYIMVVNPSILGSTGMDKSALITATALTIIAATLIVGLWSNIPIIIAPGMGMNITFAFMLVHGYQLPWETALGVIFISGAIFFILSLLGFQKKIVEAFPKNLRIGISIGIGLLLMIVGLKEMGILTANPATIIGFSGFTKSSLISCVGFLLMSGLFLLRVPGAIILAIIATYIAYILFGIAKLPEEYFSSIPSIAPIFAKLDIIGALKISLLGPILTFLILDLFDNVGSTMSCLNLLNKNGLPTTEKTFNKTITTSAFGSVIASILGSSSTSVYIESNAGIAVGAKYGLSSIVIAILFFLCLFINPILLSVPPMATAPVLLLIGLLIAQELGNLELDDFRTAMPALIILVMTPLTLQIGKGVAFGFITYFVLTIISVNHRKELFNIWSILMLAMSILEFIL